MIKRIKVKERMTGKELARMLSRSHLRWNNGAVIRKEDDGRYSYCMIGQIAKHAGVTNRTLENLGEGNAPDTIPVLNDGSKNKQECVKAFCEYDDDDIAVKSWIDDMLEWQRANRT
jgi:hypothetical protein